MRTVRWIAAVTTFAILYPAAGAAQQGHLFNDALFVGAKAGLANFETDAAGSSTEPSIGGEMLITRTHAGLLLSIDQSFFTGTSSVPDNFGEPFPVRMKDMRRYSAVVLAFPVAWGTIRPYGGVGFALNVIQNVALGATPSSGDQQAAVEANLADQKDRTAFLTMVGVQAQYLRFSIFGQATYMPAQARFLFNSRPTFFLEGGIRFNIAKSKSGSY